MLLSYYLDRKTRKCPEARAWRSASEQLGLNALFKNVENCHVQDIFDWFLEADGFLYLPKDFSAA